MNSPNERVVGVGSVVGEWSLTPARVAGIYLAVTAGALYVSDVLLPGLVASEPLVARLQFAKGVVEIVGTAALLYLVTARSWRSLEETNEHLDAARQGLSVMQRLFRHNLRNDVTVVAGYARNLADELEREPLEAHCDAIRDRCDDLITATEKAKLAAELNREGVEPTEVDLATTLESVRNRVEPHYGPADLTVSVPEGTTVLSHEYVEFAVLEVVENAIVHQDDAEPTVAVRSRESPEYAGWQALVVEDAGPGIPEGELAAFDGEDEPLRHGSGVGLWMASWIVYRSGGEFDVENTADGCRVTITLPTPETTSTDRAKSRLGAFLE